MKQIESINSNNNYKAGRGYLFQGQPITMSTIKIDSPTAVDSMFLDQKQTTSQQGDFLLGAYITQRGLTTPGLTLSKHCRSGIVGVYSSTFAPAPPANPTFDEMIDIISDKSRRTAYFRFERVNRRDLLTYGAVWSRNCFAARGLDSFGTYAPPFEVTTAAWAVAQMKPINRRSFLVIYSSRPPCDYPGGSDATTYCWEAIKEVFTGLNRWRRDYSKQILYISDVDADNYLVFHLTDDTVSAGLWASDIGLEELVDRYVTGGCTLI